MKNLALLTLFFLINGCDNNVAQQNAKATAVVFETPDLKTIKDLPLPKDYIKMKHSEFTSPTGMGSFGAYLQNLPLKKDKTVYLYNGEKKRNQTAQYAVVDVSVGTRDLQQCADAVMRLRGEYLFAQKQYDKIHFKSVEGQTMRFVDWANGNHNLLKKVGSDVALKPKADVSKVNFLKYMDFVFAYASTLSLVKELKPVAQIAEIKIGDVFIKGGAPGHAIIVVDMAQHKQTGKKIFLIAQSYMPAQDIHILVNPNDVKLSPWYSETFDNQLITPEWAFEKAALRRF